MPKWTDYEVQRGFTDWADLCDAHNADIDALTAERDELKRRLDEVVAMLAQDRHNYGHYARAVAIAEGHTE